MSKRRYPKDQLYVVMEMLSNGQERLLNGRPSVALIQAYAGAAWMRDEGIWRLKEDGDPKGTKYKLVKVIKNPMHV